MTTQQMNAVDHGINRGASSVLIHAHAPQRRDLQFGISEYIAQHPDLISRNAGQFFHVFWRVWFKKCLVVVKRNRLAVQVWILLVGGFEAAERLHEITVVGAIADQQMRDAVGNGQIPVALHLKIVLARLGRPRAPRTDVNQRDFLTAAASVDHARKTTRDAFPPGCCPT